MERLIYQTDPNSSALNHPPRVEIETETKNRQCDPVRVHLLLQADFCWLATHVNSKSRVHLLQSLRLPLTSLALVYPPLVSSCERQLVELRRSHLRRRRAFTRYAIFHSSLTSSPPCETEHPKP
jgi:hypothetical protein